MRILLHQAKVLNRSYGLSSLNTLRCQSRYAKEYDMSINKREEYWGGKVDMIDWIKKPDSIFNKNVSPYEKW